MLKVILPAAAALALFVSVTSPALACACCGTWQVRNVAAYDVLNIRSGPSVNYKKVGSIPSGSACVIRTGRCKRGWCRISFANFEGWVNRRYLGWFEK
ncbi:MAG: SH3 domain-containing protein [Alphaproteobacteria bacterium]|nr:SH3 domain-containing protein [Alphaproteobacteria bacterium]